MFLVLGLRPQVFCQEPATLTLMTCVEKALSANLKLIEARLEKEAKNLQADASFKELLPKLSTQYSYLGRRDVDTVTIYDKGVRISSHDTYDWSLILTQPVFQGGALWNRYKTARIDYDMSKKRLQQISNDIVRQVKEAYYLVLQAQKIQEERKAAVKRLEAHLRDAEGFYEVGLIARNDLLQSRVELAQARQDLVSAVHDTEIARARLNLLLRQDLNTPLELEGGIKEVPEPPAFQELKLKAMRLRPEIQAGELAVEKAKKELKIAKSAYLPRVDLTATYRKRGVTPDVSDYPFGDHDMAQVMMNMTWELWAWGKTNDQVKAASYSLLVAQTALDEVKDAVALEVKEAWLRLKEARANVEVAKSALDQAEENFRLNTQRYKEQLATSTDVLDAQALLTKARTNFYNALAQELITSARLDYAVGTGKH